MKVAAQPNFQPIVAANRTAVTEAPAAVADTTPKDTVVTSSNQKPPSDTGQFVKMGVGGVATLGLAIPSMYAGILGGGIVGSIFGAGIGPAVAAVSSHGAMNFISTAFHTTSYGAQVGIVVGGLSGLLGAGAVGMGIGQTAGRVFGLSSEPAKPADLKAHDGTVPSILAGIGGLGGFVGGAAIGAGVAVAGSIANGIAAQGIAGAFTSAPVAAAIGGIAGGALFGLIGGKGGVMLAKGVDNAAKGTVNLYNHVLGKTGDGETLEAKNKRLAQLQVDLKGQQVDLTGQADVSRKDYNVDKTKIDERETGVVAQETDVKNREKQIDDKIETQGQAAFTARSQDLRDWKGRLDTREGQQNKQEGETKGREAQIDKEIDQEAGKIFGQRRVALEENYRQLQAGLDTKEQGLNTYESRIHEETERRYHTELAPRESDLRNQISSAAQMESMASQRRSQAQSEASQASSARQQAQSQLDQASRDHNAAQSEVDSINNATSNLRSQLSELQGESRELDAKQSNIEARERN